MSGTFSTLIRLFRAFLTPAPRRPGNPLFGFFSEFSQFRSFLGRGLLDPVEGQRCPNACWVAPSHAMRCTYVPLCQAGALKRTDQKGETYDPATIYRSLRALRARNPKKVSKRVFLGVCKKVPENTRKSRKIYPKLDFLGYFSTFSGIFGDFLQTPKNTLLETFLGFRARRVRRLL